MARKLLSLAVAVSVLPSVALAQRPPSRIVVRDLARELACAPQALLLPPAPTMIVVRGEDEKKALFGTGEALIVSGGRQQGMKEGQEYFVRRRIDDQFAVPVTGFLPVSVRTAAWVRIVEVNDRYAVARISYACDGVVEGDYLEPFVRPVIPVNLPPAEPDFSSAGYIIMGNERRQTGAAGDMMVLDRGTEHGIRPGQRLMVFRDTVGGAGPIVRIGEAIAVVVRQDMSVVRIESSRDVVYVGDRLAPEK